MPDEKTDILHNIPSFDELSFPEVQPGELIVRAEKIAQELRGLSEPAGVKSDLHTFQQKILEGHSFLAFEKIAKATAKEDRPGTTFLEEEIHVAKSIVYEAIAEFPYESMAASSEATDLWSRSWRWKQFEKNVPEGLLRKEAKLKQEIMALRPNHTNILSELAGEIMALDSSIADEKRHIFCNRIFYALEKSSDRREQLLLELFNVRREIAIASGYQSYSDWHEARRGKRSFNRREEEGFVTYYVAHFREILEEVQDLRETRWSRIFDTFEELFLLAPQGQVPMACTEDDIKEKMIAGIEKITSHREHFLISLIEKSYASSDPRICEALGETAILLPSVPACYLCLAVMDEFTPITQLFYKSGEALADLSAMLNYHVIGSSNQDAFSKAVSGFSFLSLSYHILEDFYEEASDLAYDYEWSRQLIMTFLNIAIYSLENSLYKINGKLSTKLVTDLWKEIVQEVFPFIVLDDEQDKRSRLIWQYLLSYSIDPYQSLAQVLAFVTVLAEGPRRLSRNVLSTKLNQFLLTNPGGAIVERLEAADLRLAYEPETIHKAAFALCDLLEL